MKDDHNLTNKDEYFTQISVNNKSDVKTEPTVTFQMMITKLHRQRRHITLTSGTMVLTPTSHKHKNNRKKRMKKWRLYKSNWSRNWF